MKRFDEISLEIINSKVFQKMKNYPSHGNMSCFDHSYNVALSSYNFVLKHNIKCDVTSLVRGALMHDFYLYNWHHPKINNHLFKHPLVALSNALKYFKLNKKEENIITSHMFPITLFHIPKCKEAWIVCLFDKVEAFKEALGYC